MPPSTALCDALPDMIVLHVDGRIAYANPAAARILGVAAPAELLGREILDFVHPDYRGIVRERIAGLTNLGDRTEPLSERLLRANGSSFEAEVHGTLVEHEGKRGVLVVVRDVTQLQEERVRDHQRDCLDSLGVFAGGVAHDFNDLLTGVLGHAQVALQDLEPDHPARPAVEAAYEVAARAADWTRDMLVCAGRSAPSWQRVELGAVAEAVVGELRKELGNGVRIEVHDSGAPSIEADPQLIEKLLRHLIVNAAESVGGRAGTVRVEVGRAAEGTGERWLPCASGKVGPCASLSVSDDGEGMVEATRLRAFEPFFSTKFSGRGLGLSVVLGVVRAHAGGVEISSAPGHGTTVEVHLPCKARSGAKASSREASAPEQARAILIVDDEEIVLGIASEFLRRDGFEVLTAGSGVAAVEIFRERGEDIGLVLLDLSMPIMDGEATHAALRAIRPEVKVVYSSGYTDYVLTEKERQAGPVGFIRKPYGPVELTKLVRTSLS